MLVVAALALVAATVGVVKCTVAADEPKGRQESEADRKMVEQALGKAGQLMPGGVYRVAMPRTDLKVRVQMPFWANDDAVKLAQGLKTALDLTNSKKAER